MLSGNCSFLIAKMLFIFLFFLKSIWLHLRLFLEASIDNMKYPTSPYRTILAVEERYNLGWNLAST